MKTGLVLTAPWGTLVLLLVVLLGGAGAYLGGLWAAVAAFLTAFLVLDGLHFLWAWSRWRFDQNFSTNHPVKGQSLDFKLVADQTGWFPGIPFRLHVKFERSDQLADRFPLTGLLWGKHTVSFNKALLCPFRGSYELGVEGLEFQDLLGIFVLHQKSTCATFYVQPQVRAIPLPEILVSGFTGLSSGSRGTADPSVFDRLSPWTFGDSLRQVSWRHLATRGLWIKKEPGRLAPPGVRLLLDGRRTTSLGDSVPEEVLAAEDRSLEVFLGLGKVLLERGIPMQALTNGLSSPGWHDDQDFAHFFERFKTLAFGPGPRWTSWFHQEKRTMTEGQVWLLVTHVPDPELESLAEDILTMGALPVFYITTTLWDPAVSDSWHRLWTDLRHRGIEVFLDP